LKVLQCTVISSLAFFYFKPLVAAELPVSSATDISKADVNSNYCDSITEKDSWKSGDRRGWFFNNPCVKRPDIEEKDKKKEKVQEVAKPATEQPKLLTDWKKFQDRKELYKYLSTLNGKQLKEFMDNVLLEASVRPSEDIARVFFYTQRYMFNNAVQFASAYEKVTLQEPYLNPVNTSLYSASVSSTYAERTIKPLLYEEYAKTAKEVSEKSGILFFVSATCPFCKAQAPIIENLRLEYGLKYRTISRDSCDGYKYCVVKPEKFMEHNIDYVPAIIAIFIVNDKPVYQPLAYGVTQGIVIIDRLYRLYNSYQGKDVIQGANVNSSSIPFLTEGEFSAEKAK